jgi:hypothetical protein
MVPGGRAAHENLHGVVAKIDAPQHLLDLLLQNRTAAAGRRRAGVINIG